MRTVRWVLLGVVALLVAAGIFVAYQSASRVGVAARPERPGPGAPTSSPSPSPTPPATDGAPSQPPSARPSEDEQQKAHADADAGRKSAEKQREIGQVYKRESIDKPPATGEAARSDIAAVCLDGAKCTPVRVLFGTDRKRADTPKRIAYGVERANDTELGQAVVTVPKVQRKAGEVLRPGWIDTWIRRVPVEGDPAQHFTIPENGIFVYPTVDAFVDVMRAAVATGGRFKDHAFVFVHGFDTSFDDALYRTAQIAYDLGEDGEPFGTAFMFSWPSRGEQTLWGYGYDEDSARLYAAEHLKSFIGLVAEKSGAQHVHVIAHSMGNVALLEALRQLAVGSERGPVIDQLVLAAPDVDKGWFEKVAASIVPAARNTTLYASSSDLAMQAARRFRAGAPRAGDVPDGGPVIAPGIETVDISSVNTDMLSYKHNDYAETSAILADIKMLFLEGGKAHPPEKRQVFEPQGEGSHLYWKYVR